MAKNISPAWLLVLFSGCGRNEPPPRVPLQWTEADGTPVRDPGRTSESIRHRQREEARASRAAAQEPNVPRMRCNDGTRAINCSAVNANGDCCAGQGGVYHDAWGNLVYE